jgi:ketosteroid isomerase-like protein
VMQLGARQQDNLDLVNRLYGHVFKGDFVSAEQYLAEDFVVSEADGLPFRGVFRGRQALGETFRRLLHYFRDLKVEITAVTAGGDHVMGLLQMSGEAKVTGRRFSIPVVEVFRFEDGLIAEIFPVYWDTKLIAEITKGE